MNILIIIGSEKIYKGNRIQYNLTTICWGREFGKSDIHSSYKNRNLRTIVGRLVDIGDLRDVFIPENSSLQILLEWCKK